MADAFIRDRDFTLYVGDVRDVVRELPEQSVDCIVTSPPYWGLRDYGTGSWEGGDPSCDHRRGVARAAHERKSSTLEGGTDTIRVQEDARDAYRDACGKCGATRIDSQLGLERTPEQYVDALVAVFAEIRRVMTPHGTVWLNLGDSYASGSTGRSDAEVKFPGLHRTQAEPSARRIEQRTGHRPKNLIGIPWRVAFALQADGWFLRCDVVWSKPNAMPEGVADRPTRSHEYVFLLTKRPRYYFDGDAVREPNRWDRTNGGLWPGFGAAHAAARRDAIQHYGADESEPTVIAAEGRNLRSVWEITTKGYAEAHFATYPEELVRRCLLAGCPEWVCVECGRPRERIVDYDRNGKDWRSGDRMQKGRGAETPQPQLPRETVGWTDCGHGNYRPGVVLDPFIGSGTTALVARKLGRHAIGIELSPEYAELCAKRTRQLSLIAETARQLSLLDEVTA